MKLFVKARDWLGKLLTTAEITDTALIKSFDVMAIKDVALYTSVSLIADIIAKSELQIIKDGETVKNSMWYKWNVAPNDNKTASELMTQWIFDLYYNDYGGLVVPVGDNLYNASGFAVDENPLEGDIYRGITIGDRPLGYDVICKNAYYCRLGAETWRGYSSMRQMVDRYFEANAGILKSSITSATRGAGEKYVLNIDHLPYGTEEQNNDYLESVKNNMAGFINADTAVYPALRGQALTRVSSVNNNGSTNYYTTIRKDIFSAIAGMLHIPASFLEGSLNAANEIANQMLTYAVAPVCQKLETEITKKTFTETQIINGCRAKFDLTGVRHIDILEMASQIEKMISSGVMCIDEVRKRIGLDELNTDWAEAHYITQVFTGINDLNKLQNPNEGDKHE